MSSAPAQSQENIYRVKRSGETVPLPTPQEAPTGDSSNPSAISQQAPVPQVPSEPPPDAAKLYLWEEPTPKKTRRHQREVASENYLDHSILEQVLRKYVNPQGWVNYRGLVRDKRARRSLQAYVDDLSARDPSTLEDPMDRLAAWLNLYNSMIILEILKFYPIKSLMQIPDFYAKPRFHIGGQDLSLLQIEKEIFQEKLREPRAILARVNGAASGPRMLRAPFKPTQLDEQLDEQTWKFLMDRGNVDYDSRTKTLRLNPTFLWYQEEFGDLFQFLRAYLDLLPSHFLISYHGYDWKLNDEKLH